eukprot:1160641-Pelagomonas_calceolata.AAC.18
MGMGVFVKDVVHPAHHLGHHIDHRQGKQCHPMWPCSTSRYGHIDFQDAPRQGQPSILPLTKKKFTSKIKNRRGVTYKDGSVIKHKDDSSSLVGSGVYKPNRDTTQSSHSYSCT